MTKVSVRAMGDRELRIRVAALSGWKCPEGCKDGVQHRCPDCGCWDHGQCDGVGSYHNTMPCNHQPDYTHDLNAMYEAEKRLSDRQAGDYDSFLWVIIRRDGTRPAGWHATPRQKAEAFVLAKEAK